MRVLDRPLPTVALDAVPQLSTWPVRPVIAIYGHLPLARWDGEGQQGVRWDASGATWDQPFAPGYRDATCAWFGCEIDTGLSDEAYLFPATRAVVQLDNKDGSWSAIDADGTPSDYGPGTPLSIWAHAVSGDWWLFDGFVARWDQRADDTIEIEAFDIFSDLAQPIGTYTPGSNGQKLSARLTAVLTAAGESARPKRFDTGQVTLTAQETDLSPLEEMQIVAGSDGGVLFVDADGTLVGRDRTWRAGRTDQVVVPTVSWNVATADVCLWEPVITADDEGLADRVVLENRTEPDPLRAVAGTTPGFVFSQTEQQWTTQLEGDGLAALLLTDRQKRRIKLSEFDLYLLDPNQPELWRMVDMRRLDKLRFVHDQRTTGGGSARVDVNVLVEGLIHTIQPEGWVMSVATSKVITFTLPPTYDAGDRYDQGELYGY